MLRYISHRILISIPTLLALMTLTFFIMKAVPGGPFDGEKALSPEIRANLDAKFHFDEPVSKQYVRYLGNILHGDFGPSYRFLGSREVNEIILEGLPVSAQLGVIAILIAILFGIPLGVIAAFKKNTFFDYLFTFFSVIGISLPNFLVASLLILVFSIYLGWFPPALWEGPSSAILPVLTLSVRPLALVMRLTRASMLETLSLDYIRTAAAKGLSQYKILFKHALKNSLVPVITLLGPLTSTILTGSFVVEMIFAIPGLGKHYVTAVLDRDYPLIMGITIVYGLILVVSNLAVDLLYGYVDPRIRDRSYK